VAACNRVGFEPAAAASASAANGDADTRPDGILFWGNSFVCGPQGEVIARATGEREELLITDIDLARTEQVRRIWPCPARPTHRRLRRPFAPVARLNRLGLEAAVEPIAANPDMIGGNKQVYPCRD
jgi:hypothetical protein